MLHRILAAGFVSACLVAFTPASWAQETAPAPAQAPPAAPPAATQPQPMAPGMAPGRGRGGGMLRTYCLEDIRRLCKGMKPGGGRILNCLRENQNGLSVGCAKALEEMKARRGGQ